MKDILFGLFMRLMPPPVGSTPEEERQWMTFIALTNMLVAATLVTHIALACGFLASIYSGFASASEVEVIKSELRQNRETDLGVQILSLRKEQCAASGGAKVLYTNTISRALADYQKLTGRTYPLPACSDYT